MSGRDPHLGLLLLVVPRLPHALDHAVVGLVNVPALHPNVLNTCFVVAYRLLDDDWLLHHDWRRRNYDRLLYDYRRWMRCIVDRRRNKPSAKHASSNTYRRASAMMMVVMVTRGRWRRMMTRRGTSRAGAGTTAGARSRRYT